MLDLVIKVIILLSRQQVINTLPRDEGYVYTLRLRNNKTGKVHYAHVLVVSYTSVYIAISEASNWRNVSVTEFTNTSNHDECWASSGFTLLEKQWEALGIDFVSFYTGTFGFKLYEHIKITREVGKTNFYNLLSLREV